MIFSHQQTCEEVCAARDVFRQGVENDVDAVRRRGHYERREGVVHHERQALRTRTGTVR